MQLITTQNTRTLPHLRRFAPHYALLRAALQLGAYLSDGIATGFAHGFDSGPMLDYVYRNQPSGRTSAGRLADQIYLNQIGWRAIRARKTLLQNHLRTALETRQAQGLATHIIDVAAGPGRYLLELLAELDRDAVRVTCRDLDGAALEQGRQLAAGLGLTEQVRYEPGNATDPADLAQIRPAPDLVVVSGLYEILTDDAAVCRSLRGIRTILAPGGALLFTTQVQHPQLELIANVLTNREGKPWVMGTRPLARVERWAREAGFHSVDSTLEPNGLFGVTHCVV